MFTGERFPTDEATTLFFGISKLFQNKDPSLRQMVYLILKELSNTAQDVIMSTSIIMKDTSVGSDVLYRANAIRALCRIIDVRYLFICKRKWPLLLFNVIYLPLFLYFRPPLYRVSSDSLRLPLWIRRPRFPPPL